jgi:Xaa-Pro aminopeptidase
MRTLTISLLALTAGAAVRAPAQSRSARPAAPAGPIGAHAVVPELPGMGRAIDTAATAARRRALLQRIGAGTVIVPGAHERNLELDYLQDNDFRQHNTFFYFTELEAKDAWLLMTARPSGEGETILFLPSRNPARERWTGLAIGPDSVAVRLTGIARVLPTDSLERYLGRAAFAGGPIYLPLDVTTRHETRVLDAVFRGRDVRNLRPIVDSLRLVKDADEIARLQRAVDISVAGHIAAMQAARPGMYEYELEAALEAGFRRHGADRLGYPSIVGSGYNTTTLHYDINRRQTRDGDLVVIDAAAEWGQYTADVTRTFPVNGRFTPRQKAIYDLVLATQQAVFDSITVGVTSLRDLNRVSREYMRAHSGTLCGERTCDAYYIHGLGHGIGMDVHDVGDYSLPLVPGMTFTLEPGIYIPEESLGVRIEDCVLITANGPVWMSAGAPRTTADVERVMREGRRR